MREAALLRSRYKLADVLSRMERVVTDRLRPCGGGIKTRHGRSEGYMKGGHREGSMQRLSMEGVTFNGPGRYVKIIPITA